MEYIEVSFSFLNHQGPFSTLHLLEVLGSVLFVDGYSFSF